MAAQVSERPWSSYGPSDYTDAQWLRACLVVRPPGDGSAKQRGSVPVREPDGTLNKGGMAAAAAVLGSKGGSGNARGNTLSANDQLKSKARSKLISLYNSAGLDLPDSLQHEDFEEEYLEHYGIKGMRWGVRRSTNSEGYVNRSASEKSGGDHASGGHPSETHAKRPGGMDGDPNTSADHERATKALAKAESRGKSSLSNEELQQITKRIEAEKKFQQLTTDQKSELQKQVDQLQLEKQYRTLMSEKKMAERSTGRKIVDSLINAGVNAAQEQAASYGSQLVKDLLKQSGGKGVLNAPKPSGKFKVNPAKVKVSRPYPAGNNLPQLKPNSP